MTAAGALTLLARAASAQSAAGSVSVGASVSASANVSAQLTAQPPSREDIAAVLGRIPLRIGIHGGVGWTRSWERPLLDGYATETGGSLGVWATPWLAIEGRGTYIGLLRRLSDNDGDGRADSNPGFFQGILAIAQGRFRLREDSEKVRNGWSFSIGGGALIPWVNTEGRGVGPVLEAAVARHVGVISHSGSALDLSFDLRVRTGLGSLIDYQSVVGTVGAAWEGNQRVGAAVEATRGYRPGHTAGIEALVGGWFSAPTVPGTNILWSNAGGGVSLHAGLVLSSGFELTGRVGYLGRGPGREGDDWLNFGFFEGGVRARWYLFYAEGNAGLFAPFGTFRDRVATEPFAGGALGLRLPFNRAEDPGFRFLLGLRARVGLMQERAFDGLFFTAGFEFEGGPQHAAFPRFTPAAQSAAASVSVQASGPAEGTATGHTLSSDTGVASSVAPVRPPVTRPDTTTPAVSTGVSTSAPATAAGGDCVGVTAPLRVSLGTGITVGSRGLGRFDLDGSSGAHTLAVGWVPARWLSLELTGGLLVTHGHNGDADGDGRVELRRDGMLQGTLTLGPRFRLLTDDVARFGWSVHVAGGLIASPVALGPLGEVAIAHHFAAITSSHMALELGIEARGRLGWMPNQDLPSNGAIFQGIGVGLTAAWEGNVHRNGAPMSDAQLGETLSIETGYGLAFSSMVGARSSLGASLGTVGVRTGLVFTPGFEWSARAAYVARTGTQDTATHEYLFAESGPRFRWGWTYGELAVGYAGTIQAYRDSVASSLTGSVGAGVRFGLTGRGHHFGFTAGLLARFGLSPERAYDALFLMAGFELEGGRRQAHPFPEMGPSPRPAARPAQMDVSTTSPRYQATGGVTQTHTVTIPTTSPRYQATGGVTQTHTVTIPTSVEMGVSGSVGLGGVTTVNATVLTAGAVVYSSPFGTGVSLTEDELVAMLPSVDGTVRGLDVALRVPATVSALSVEGVLRAAIARRYAGATVQVTARVIVGGSSSGRFELELRAR